LRTYSKKKNPDTVALMSIVHVSRREPSLKGVY
jgi:hypothetical protein